MGVSNRKLFTVRRRIHISRKIYGTKVDSKYRQIFESKRLNHSADTSAVLFTVHDVISVINKQTFCKAILQAQMVYRWMLLLMDVTVCMYV